VLQLNKGHPKHLFFRIPYIKHAKVSKLILFHPEIEAKRSKPPTSASKIQP
jgi:hypothetical protein